jgi:hypothetical protein
MKKKLTQKNCKTYNSFNLFFNQKIINITSKTLFLFSFLFFITPTTEAQSVAITGWDSTVGDEFSFVLLRDFTAGEIIYFTEDEYVDASNTFSFSEGHISYTIPAGGLSKNEVITITETSPNTFSVGCGVGGTAIIVGSATWSTVGSEEIYAYSASNASTPWNSVSEIHCFLWTGISAYGTGQEPVNDYPNVIKIAINLGGTSSDADFKDSERTNTTLAMLQNTANWTKVTYNGGGLTLSCTNFTNQQVVISSTAPTVTTTAASSIANTSATLAGNVTADGGETVTERGIVYSTSDTTPTIAEGATKDTNSTGTGVFTESITSLTAGTIYYFNAYAINSVGTSYGTSATFTTTGKGWTGATDTNWATASNWNPNSTPTNADNLVIPNVSNKPIIASGTNAAANNITIDATSSLTINEGGSLTMDGNLTQNGTFNINSDATTNGSLIVKGTSSGNVTYKRYLTNTNWHLIAAPVNSQPINDFSSSFLTSATNNKSISPYNNAVVSASRWSYYTTANIASAGNFTKAKGYSVKKATAGTLDFTGTLNTATSETIAITDGGDDPAGNRWNLVGNPFTASLNGSDAADATNNFLKINIDAGNLDPARAGLYLWNGAAYVEKSVDDPAFYIAPGQGFFVHAPDAGATSVSFTEDMQTHQTGNIFLRGSGISYPEIILNVTEDKNSSSTKIRYIGNKTKGLDPGSDVGTFTGTNSNFKAFTHLISDSKGIDFAIQALPNTDYD